MNRLFVNNSAGYRLLRTIIQGVIGVLLVNGGDYIMQIVTHIPLPDWLKPILVALIMAILSPIMKSLGTYDMDKAELDNPFNDQPLGYEYEEEEDDETDSE